MPWRCVCYAVECSANLVQWAAFTPNSEVGRHGALRRPAPDVRCCEAALSQFGFNEQFGSLSVLAICLARPVWVNWWALPSAKTIFPALTCIVLSQRGLSATLS